MQPTRLTLFAAAAGFSLALLPAVGLEKAWALWIAAWTVLATGLGCDLIMLLLRRKLVHQFESPKTLYVGEPSKAKLFVRFVMQESASFAGIVDLSENLRDVAPLSGELNAEGVEIAFPLLAHRRGVATIESVVLRFPGPLGLLQRTVRIALDWELSVVPNIVPVQRTALRFLSDRRFQAGLKIEKYQGDGTEFDSLREFVVGDDNRAIHWRASARHRLLLQRQYRAERNHQVILGVDCGRLMSEPLLTGISKVDHAVTAALLMSYIGIKSRDRVGLYSFSAMPGIYLEAQGGSTQYRKLAHVSAEINYSDAETNYTLGLTTLMGRLKRRSLVIVLTDFVDTVTAEMMIDNLGRLAQRHVVVFVSLRDPDLEVLARESPTTALRMHRANVAQSQIQDRRLVLRRLESLGMYTIDAEPDKIGVELINKYLDIKRREVI